MIYYIIYAVVGYLIGSIPFGYILVKLIKGIDIRTVGSGNTGATNVGRIAGLKWGMLCFLLDLDKGFLPTLAILFIHPSLIGTVNINMTDGLSIGLGIIVGHLFPLYLGFRGGKGVATSLGVFWALALIPTTIAVIIWGLFFILLRYISLASIIAAISLPISFWFMANLHPRLWEPPVMISCILVALLIIIRHIPNIKRLIKGTEPKVKLWGKSKDERTEMKA
ncbi:MAG: glycerol-3-phosphate 1-O-acyltransferase PlsY [Planctomycetota bacterium]